jgi:hypothetical protein
VYQEKHGSYTRNPELTFHCFFDFRLPPHQERRLEFTEWLAERGLMVEDDGDTRGVRFLGRKRRYRKKNVEGNKAGAYRLLTAEEKRRALLGMAGDYKEEDVVEPGLYAFELAKERRTRVPYIVKMREEKAAREAAEALQQGIDAFGAEDEEEEEEGGKP